MSALRPLDDCIRQQLVEHLDTLEQQLNADVMAIISDVVAGLEHSVRNAIESKKGKRRNTLAIILDTPGGVVEVVERMVNTIRKNYSEVIFIVPDKAMSAGTVFVMSGDRIMMDYFSCLGPIDPQIEKDDKLIPALSYLNQFERLKQLALAGQLTSAEFALLDKLDLAELHQFEQAKVLSIDLLETWLSAYKFKNWAVTQSRKKPVTAEMRRKRAKEIAELLSDNERWHSHGRGIGMDRLRNEVNLQIEDFGADDKLAKAIKDYFGLLRDYMFREKMHRFVHAREYF
jgi:hypothetical protein